MDISICQKKKVSINQDLVLIMKTFKKKFVYGVIDMDINISGQEMVLPNPKIMQFWPIFYLFIYLLAF